MPADLTLYAGALLIFAGRRWKVTAVDHAHKIIEAVPAPGGRPPRFNGGVAGVHDRVRAEMRSVLAAESVPRYLSHTAVSLLNEARAAYTRYHLDDRSILQAGPHTLLVPWTGSKAVTTLAAQLCAAGLDASNDGLIITVASVAADHVRQCLAALVAAGPADPVALAVTVANKEAAKYDEWIDDELLAIDYARRALDTDGAWRTTEALLVDKQPYRLDLTAAQEEQRHDVTGEDSVVRTRAERGRERPLVTKFGQVMVSRIAYRSPGRRSVHPLDAALNLPEEKHSHGLRRLASIEAARGSMEAAGAAITRATGVTIGKRQLEELARRCAAHVEAFYLQRAVSPAPDDHALVLTFDGKGIVMLPGALRPATA
jgi:hypothetical protein